MLLLLLHVVAKSRGKGWVLPRMPQTIAGQLSYLVGSRMALELSEMRRCVDEDIRKEIEAQGLLYALSWREGLDGKARWIIDYDMELD